MEVTLKEITIRDLVRDYKDHDEEGITGYGRLDIRPPFKENLFIMISNRKQ